MIGSTFLHALVAQLAYQEGKDNGINGQLAVVFCIKNRVDTGWYAGGLGEVLQDEFSSLSGLDIPDVRDPVFQQLLSVIEEIFEGKRVDKLTCGALWWTNNYNILRQRVAQVGTMNLWR